MWSSGTAVSWITTRLRSHYVLSWDRMFFPTTRNAPLTLQNWFWDPALWLKAIPATHTHTHNFSYILPDYAVAKLSPRLFSLSYLLMTIKLLATDFFFQISAHPVFKMWVVQKPNKVALWNKRHFEEKKKWRLYSMFKIFSMDICWINIKRGI